MRTITIKEMVERYGYNLFDFEYDLIDKDEFEKRFKDTYWFRNIGFETTTMFLHYLRVNVQRLTPKYNMLHGLLNGINLEIEQGDTTTRTYDSTDTELIKVDSEGEASSTSMNQELGYAELNEVDFDNISMAVNGINAGANTETRDGTKTGLVNENTFYKNMPMYKAIENVKKIRLDITQELIEELNDLFSLVYY